MSSRNALNPPRHAPYPDTFDHALFRKWMRTAHDVGGEPDTPMQWEEKQEEQWELNTYVTCEALAWRGIWNAEERRRRQNVDIGHAAYLGLPYYGRWLLTAARILVDKQYITLTELIDKLDEVKKREIPEKKDLKKAANAKPVARSHHADHATGVGDPQCFKGKAGPAKFKVGDKVRIKDLPDVFYTRSPLYTRGAIGTVAVATHESPAPEDEAWDNTDKSEWFYIVRFRQKDLWPEYSDRYAQDTLQTEFSERWLEKA